MDTLADSSGNASIILITGAGKGIGAATVLEIIKRKAELKHPKLVLTARTLSDLEKLKSLSVAAGVECEILAAELTDHPCASVELAIKKFGRIDILIHSAGVGRFGNFLDLTSDDLAFVMKTNVEASFQLMQETYRQMQKQKSGSIVWVTSIAAEIAFEQSAVYCMSKFAQRGLIEVMRLQARKDGIRIIDVKPGATYTPMWGEISDEMKSRMMQASDIATLMVDAIRMPSRATIEEILVRPLGGDL